MRETPFWEFESWAKSSGKTAPSAIKGSSWRQTGTSARLVVQFPATKCYSKSKKCEYCDGTMPLKNVRGNGKKVLSDMIKGKKAEVSEAPDLPDEPHLTIHGGTITESEYKLANRHTIYCWIFMFTLGIPIFLLSIFLFRRDAIVISIFLITPLYPLALKFFPGAKKFGTMIYRKYKARRSVILAKFEKFRREEATQPSSETAD